MADLSDDELLAELGVAIELPKARTYTPREERIIAGFEDIVRFREKHGRLPQHGEDCDIFERLYAVRLDRVRELDECRDLLRPLDTYGLLNPSDGDMIASVEDIDDDALLAELGIAVEPAGDDIDQAVADADVDFHLWIAVDEEGHHGAEQKRHCIFEDVDPDPAGRCIAEPVEIFSRIADGLQRPFDRGPQLLSGSGKRHASSGSVQ